MPEICIIVWWCVLSCSLLFAAVLLYAFLRHFLSPLRALPGDLFPTEIFRGQISRHINLDHTIFDELERNRSKFGSCYRVLHYYGRNRVSIGNPEGIHHVLVSNAANYKRGSYLGVEHLELLSGKDNILMVSGETHKRLRRIATPGFRASVLKNVVTIVEGKASQLSDRWTTFCEGHQQGQAVVLDIKEDLAAFTLDVIGLVGMELDFGALDPSGCPLAKSMNEMIDNTRAEYFGMLPCYRSIFQYLRGIILSKRKPPWFLGSRLCEYLSIVTALTSRCWDAVLKKRDSFMGADPDASFSAKMKNKDLLTHILRSSDRGGISSTEMMDLCMAFILAGHETSSSCLTWTLWILAGKPEIQAKVAAEVHNYLTEFSGQLFQWEHLHNVGDCKLPYTLAVIQESLRLYPPVPWLSRVSVDADHLCGYDIPPGTDIVLVIAGMHRNPDIWGPSVLEFIPERFMPDDQAYDHAAVTKAFMPFGDGLHKCIGYQLALTELLVAAVRIFAKFKFCRLPGDATKERAVITLVPQPKVLLSVSLRE